MKKEQTVRRAAIEEAWSDFPIYTCELCEHYLDEFPDDGFIWAESLEDVLKTLDLRRRRGRA
jgi:hypothetical protein